MNNYDESRNAVVATFSFLLQFMTACSRTDQTTPNAAQNYYFIHIFYENSIQPPTAILTPNTRPSTDDTPKSRMKNCCCNAAAVGNRMKWPSVNENNYELLIVMAVQMHLSSIFAFDCGSISLHTYIWSRWTHLKIPTEIPSKLSQLFVCVWRRSHRIWVWFNSI